MFVLQVCSQSELRKLVCIKIWNGMNLASMQIFRSVILITGYVTLKPRQLNFNDTFPLTYSTSSQFTLYCISKPRVSNCLVNKSRLACVISIYLASALMVKGRLLLTNSMLKLGLKNPRFHLPKSSLNLIAAETLLMNIVSFEKAMYHDAFSRSNFAQIWHSPCKMNFKLSVKFWKFLEISRI